MSFERTDRISEEVRRELTEILRNDVRDPRIGGTFSVTRAEVTRDLRYCKVRVSVLEEERRKPFMAALKSGAGFLRRELGQRMQLRYTPELLFELDTNIEYAVHIAHLLDEAAKAHPASEARPDDAEIKAEIDDDGDIEIAETDDAEASDETDE